MDIASDLAESRENPREAGIEKVRRTRLVNKLGPCPKAKSWLQLWDKTTGQCLTFILSANGSPTAPPPLATQCDIHLYHTERIRPLDEKAISELNRSAQ